MTGCDKTKEQLIIESIIMCERIAAPEEPENERRQPDHPSAFRGAHFTLPARTAVKVLVSLDAVNVKESCRVHITNLN